MGLLHQKYCIFSESETLEGKVVNRVLHKLNSI